MNYLKRLAAVLLIAAITACSALGVDSPQTFNEKAAAAQISVTATRSTALQLLNAGKITAADAKNVQAAADAGNAAIDLARQLEATDKTGAGAKLASAVAIITGVQAYLATKGASK
jgi:predicted kinase